MKRLRIYVDTSVIGGCFDPEFATESQALIQMALDGRAVLVISDLLVQELQGAPEPVRRLLTSLPPESVEAFSTDEEAYALCEAYLAAGVVDAAAELDAQHVANATVARADLIVSWNLRHIVHMVRIQGYNAVNMREGYPTMAIYTPAQVI